MKQRDVGHEIHAISNLLGRKIEAGKRERGMQDITPMQTWIIRYLYDHRQQEIYQRDIEREFTITRSTVTGVLKLMEKNGFINRVSVPEDARLKKLILTAKGEELYHEMIDHIAEVEQLLVHGMTEEEVDTFFYLVGKIKKNLQ